MSISELKNKRELVKHGNQCDSSCYRCMRDYSNMSYHPLLDWRLGLDLANLCLDKDYPISLETPHWTQIVEDVKKNLVKLIDNSNNLEWEHPDPYGIPVLLDRSQKRAFILHHPLAVYDDDNPRPGPFARVFVELEEDSFHRQYINIFEAG